MTYRPHDWSELTPGSSKDPIGGHSGEIEWAGRRYVGVASAIEDAAAALQRIAEGTAGNESDAVDELSDKARDVAKSIRKAHGRYRDTGNALLRYATALKHAESRSLRAHQRGTDAADDLRRAEHAWDNRPPDEPGAPPARDPRIEPRQRLEAARSEVRAAIDDRDDAAERAKGSIHDVIDNDSVKDGFWDNHGSKIARWVSDTFGKLAMMAGIAALLVGWIPIIGQALAAVLGTIALIATAIALVADLTLMAMGEGDWLDIAFGVLSLATFGLGKVAGVAAKSSIKGLGGARRLASGRLAARARPGETSADLIRLHAGATAGMTRTAAKKAVRRALTDQRRFTPRGTGRALIEDVRGIGGNLGQLRNTGQLFTRQAWIDAYGRGLRPGVTHALGNADLADELARIRGASAAVGADDLVRQFTSSSIRNQILQTLGTAGGVASDVSKDPVKDAVRN